MSEMLNKALYYAKCGFLVIPLTPLSKIPLAGTSGSKDATKDSEVIKRWWTENPNANIGLATSNFFVLDIDYKNDELDGFKSLEILENHFSYLPITYSVSTVNHGKHYYFLKPDTVELPQRISLVTGIDVKAHDNNYIVAAGSQVKCDNGEVREYKLDTESQISKAPNWLIDLILRDEPKQSNEALNVTHERRPRYRSKTTHLLESLVKGVSEGSRNDSIAKLTGRLFAYGVVPSLAYELVLFANSNFQPPLDEKELNKTFLSIAKKEVGVSDHRK